ncbi:MAG TPA: FAD-binding protein, partial [Patescibacteria group bacterium]|nr:FAD-binding protein [Patescibacteria group bacterium]
MDEVVEELKSGGFKGEIISDLNTLDFYSHDASMFEIRPKLAIKPVNSKDVQIAVKTVSKLKNKNEYLSLTARSAGTCMSGGAINDSIIIDFLEHFKKIEKVNSSSAQAEPGVYYRDFEKQTLKAGGLMPSY